MQVTIATNVSAETVAAVKENADGLQGVNIAEDSIRVYNDAEALAPIIGYTGRPSSEELETRRSSGMIIPAPPLSVRPELNSLWRPPFRERMAPKEVTVDNLGKVLAIHEDSR